MLKSCASGCFCSLALLVLVGGDYKWVLRINLIGSLILRSRNSRNTERLQVLIAGRSRNVLLAIFVVTRFVVFECAVTAVTIVIGENHASMVASTHLDVEKIKLGCV
ncbi:hypothetical protein AUEXF2481DRAFT_641272 [Aureobasidium subglaciale EXF-2481]|uniref:Uncharacterized protein n=1 Tax=Aureobasidium subglaciale (strain EXF-2481) TaxID=1043005 RepID=A0A074ZCV7_AURSE|nr:uncharacterized protein AUEXF2481DRAFT_641272 [Aureobasidium subglaciale EXF-2481]KEQ96506.1 hypothetical protein AUEXF2481DRAFT_641272 [Aureobasidium subglaciale EXF-2481]